MRMRKLVAPIVVTAILTLLFIAYAVACVFLPLPWGLKLAVGLMELSLIGVSIYVLVERIKEVRSGEEDDLSQY